MGEHRVRAHVVTFAFVTCGLLACTANDPVLGPATRTDAGSSQPGAGSDNLLSNGDFELGCTGWTSGEANLTDDPAGRSGQGCRVCTQGTTTGYFTQQVVTRTLVPGEKYAVSAWARTVDATPSDPIGLRIVGRNAAQEELDSGFSGTTKLSATYQKLSALVTVSDPSMIEFVVLLGVGDFSGAAPNCFVVDDMTLTKLP